MTRSQTAKLILERSKSINFHFSDEISISFVVLFKYIGELLEKNIISTKPSLIISPKGLDFAAICEEFDWKVTNEDIILFVNECIEPLDRVYISSILMWYVKDKNAVIAYFNKITNNE